MTDLVLDVQESPALVVVVDESESPSVSLIIPPEPSVVTVEVPGPAGPPGEPGPPGGDHFYVHDRGTPAALWTIPHGFGKVPVFWVLGSDGALEEPDVQQVSEDVLILDFGAPVSGKAYLS